jgi:hypothetical protein
MAQENLSNPALDIPAFIDTKIYYTGVWFSPVEHGEFFGLSGDSLKRGPDKARSQLDLAIYIDIVSLGIHCGNPGGFSLERIYILCISMLVYWRAVPELPGIFFYGLTPAKVNKHNLIFGINSWHSRRIMWVWVKILLSCWTWR